MICAYDLQEIAHCLIIYLEFVSVTSALSHLLIFSAIGDESHCFI